MLRGRTPAAVSSGTAASIIGGGPHMYTSWASSGRHRPIASVTIPVSPRQSCAQDCDSTGTNCTTLTDWHYPEKCPETSVVLDPAFVGDYLRVAADFCEPGSDLDRFVGIVAARERVHPRPVAEGHRGDLMRIDGDADEDVHAGQRIGRALRACLPAQLFRDRHLALVHEHRDADQRTDVASENEPAAVEKDVGVLVLSIRALSGSQSARSSGSQSMSGAPSSS